MNPSASGWIKKLLLQLDENQTLDSIHITELYFNLRGCGFIYGSNQAVVNDYVLNSDLTKEEYAKVNLLIAFYSANKESKDSISFLHSIIEE